MNKPFYLFLFFLIGAGFSSPARPQEAPSSAGSSGVPLSDTQWKTAVEKFETAVFDLCQWLEKSQVESDKLKEDTKKSEDKITELRQNDEKRPNVFDEIRLKGLLNSLKDKLEKNSDLQHQWDEKQKDLEQKALSLIALYNDRVQDILESSVSGLDSSSLQMKLNEMALLVQKRNKVKAILNQYQTKDKKIEPLPVESFGSLKTNDRESLQLTLDLIRDRKKELEDLIEKETIEGDEIRNELKLQGKMQEFLDGIKRMNEDSDFPNENLKGSDLGSITGVKQRNKLETRLNEVQASIARNRKSLSQLSDLMVKIKERFKALDERKSP